MRNVICRGEPADLQTGVDAHVLKEGSLRNGSETNHGVSGHPPEIAEVNIRGQICSSGSHQHVMQFVLFKTLQRKIKGII